MLINYRKDSHGESMPTAHDRKPDDPDRAVMVRRDGHIVQVDRMGGTDLAGDHLNITDSQRQRLGALFAWIIEGQAKPENMIAEAARRSGSTIPQINGTWPRIRDYVNRRRDPGAQIETIEELGYHLVQVAGVIGPDDVPEYPAYSSTHRSWN